ncbi:helix-turn-helix domain-containing protein [Kitasatospora sp. NPDC005856]|uniref:ArsR/SmtB family transcription factor n=1 Tax=Kitasatospora sp. NPDC005856 TaxID=3154566 RepID=UPI0033FB534F
MWRPSCCSRRVTWRGCASRSPRCGRSGRACGCCARGPPTPSTGPGRSRCGPGWRRSARRTRCSPSWCAPASTTELARRTGLSASAVSQYLTALRDARLVSAHRAGRSVLYARTASAEALLAPLAEG